MKSKRQNFHASSEKRLQQSSSMWNWARSFLFHFCEPEGLNSG